MLRTTAGCISILLMLDIDSARTKKHNYRGENENQVFIPCPYASRNLAPSIWRMNGTEYTSATLPSIFSLDSDGLFITATHRCLDQTVFQCIDTSERGLQWRESSIGTLTVTPIAGACTRSELESFIQSLNQRNIELNHQQIEYTENYTTLAWKIIPRDCAVSQIQLHAPCQQTNPHFNISTNETKITVPSESFNDQITGELIDFNISSVSDQSSDGCPGLLDTVRFNVSRTETVNLLLGNNDCTCVEMDCQGALNVAISNPDPNQVDILCPVYGDTCYSPDICHGFNGVPFFNICEVSGSSDCKLNICFGNVSEVLNNTRLDFFVSEKVICDITLYTARAYIRSFEIKVAAATADISVNTSSREICFYSTEDCSFTELTQYNITITDFNGNILFSEEDIPEADCVTISELLSPDHAPLLVSVQPFNDYLEYRPVNRVIISDEIALRFINDSPRVNGSTITADIYYNQPIRRLQCALSGFELQDCSSGSVTFENVPRRGERNGPYSLRAVAVNADGLRTVIRTSVRPEEKGFCLAHFINDGVVVRGNTAMIEFTGLGDFETFQCNLDREGFKNCSSPTVYIGLSPGRHRLKVVPHIGECGRRRRSITINFFVC